MSTFLIIGSTFSFWKYFSKGDILIFQNIISVPTLITAYIDKKWSEINSRTYTIIKNCRVDHVFFWHFEV